MRTLIKKILIANRGEIAVRVIRTARKMGIQTVAVYSSADRESPHVRLADEAVLLGPAPSVASYLDIDKVLKAAMVTGADAIHPGYGFLSENAEFARAVSDSGITFIGPSAEAIELMGSKLAAKATVKAHGIPLVPGTDEPINDAQEALRIADQIGFPLLIKASAGGGGKGMRIVEDKSEFSGQLERARSEAQNAFGDGSVFIEKYITSPRHIEIQILADNFGNCIHLNERECSIQRRHQKVIEEAPSTAVDQDLRTRMGQDAIKVAQSCGYSGAGTVEFLLDESGQYYFLEMNTRLQVEHPVTECITGYDLVEEQILIASGEKLRIGQEQVGINGHALELRVYAEDPFNQFLPSIGTLLRYRPAAGPGIRVDDGYREGMEVPVHYDPMLAKLVVHGKTREQALDLLQEAMRDYEVHGVETTIPFGQFAVQHPAFISGNFDTHFVEKYFDPFIADVSGPHVKLAALLAAKLQDAYEGVLKTPGRNGAHWMLRGKAER